MKAVSLCVVKVDCMLTKEYITELKHRGNGDIAALVNVDENVLSHTEAYDFSENDKSTYPVFHTGDSLTVLKKIPSKSIDFCMTSPPYWGQRCYENGGIGLENKPEHFIENLLEITKEIKRVLKDSGSFWFNIGDTYKNKALQGIPWRIAIKMMDEQGWILRNDIVWNKHKGAMDSSADKLRNIHEMIFHFVKTTDYYYNDEAIRQNPQTTMVRNGAVVSSSGVCGVRYKRQIELSTALSKEEKENAMRDLQQVLKKVENSEIPDFRMIIRNQQRATHSDSEKVSGRAKELKEKGYYFLFYSKNGALPTDVWEILPEDTQNREKHYAVYPEDLCKIPILATCPPDGIVLDPFCGSGTTNKVAYDLHRKSIGIDISEKYIRIAKQRVSQMHLNLL
jgi:site-specific DNA-methyltransferase (adenine-specific)